MSDSAIQWPVACQAPLFMGFSRQEYWSGLPFPSLGNCPDQGSNPSFPHCRQILYHLSKRETKLICLMSFKLFSQSKETKKGKGEKKFPHPDRNCDTLLSTFLKIMEIIKANSILIIVK